MEKELKPGRFLKAHMVDEYAHRLKGSTSIFITEFRGLTDKELKDLRKRLKQVSSHYFIVKNSICSLALKKLKLNSVADMLEASSALSYSQGDAVSVSKTLVSFSKIYNKLKLKGGYIDGEIITEGTIRELAALPAREVLLAKLIYCINSPVVGFVSACSGIIKKLLYALKEIAKKKE